MKKAMAYLRVSSPQQAEDSRTGYARQEEEVRKYAKAKNIEIVDVYREPYTGTDSKRPEFERMLADMIAPKKKITMVLVESMDRFSRNAITGLNHLNELIIHDVDLIDCCTGESMKELVNGHPIQEFLVQIRFMVAHLERRLTGHRLAKGRKMKSKELGRYVAGPKPEYNEAFRERLYNMKKPGVTYRQVAKELNNEGIKTTRGLEWNEHRVAAVIRALKK